MAKSKSKETESIDTIIKRAVEAGRISAERAPRDACKATERRLYALPLLREKLADDLERLEELQQYGPREKSKSVTRFMKEGVRLSRDEIFEATVLNLEAEIARDRHEIEAIQKALETIAGDPYYMTVSGRYVDGMADEDIAAAIPCEQTTVWRNRKRLIQRLSIRFFGADAL